ncbi:MAG: DUF3108 domain-containing protein [Flammeovirgaceae bacterium]|nr:DUF3108 domain-containing protein [Flammeovirgaceae bacterium]
MKLFLKGVMLFTLLTSFSGEKRQEFTLINNTSFGKGEVLEYQVNFGFFTVGKASTVIEKSVFTKNDRPCYKVDAFGETLGFVSWITK